MSATLHSQACSTTVSPGIGDTTEVGPDGSRVSSRHGAADRDTHRSTSRTDQARNLWTGVRDSVAAVTDRIGTGAFDDLLRANREFAASFALAGFDGVAHAGVAMVTCMDSRIDPLHMIGLEAGDAKILRNPGGRVDDQVLVALVVGVNLLGVERILVVQHTRCAMARSSEQEMRRQLGEASGEDASWMTIGVIEEPEATLRDDVAKVRSHPLISDAVAVGGFVYDVDTGLLHPVADDR
jgi:carbonic anhydrase